MIRGLYTASSGMMVESRRLDLISNNLANADTVGFKKDQALVEAYPEFTIQRTGPNGARRIGKLGTGAFFNQSVTQFTPGRIKTTGNKLDFALQGDGFFAVRVNDSIKLTRSGNFQIGSDGTLRTIDGHQVLGERGPIKVEGDFTVQDDGTVLIEGEQVDRLLVLNTQAPVQKIGNNLYEVVDQDGADATLQPAQAAIVQGSLEMSNVNVIREMVDMIQVTRNYEANQKVIIAQDETLGKAVNELGRA